jgi:hypothetical protein
MMIASWIHDSDSPQVVSIRLFFSLPSVSQHEKVSRSDSARDAQKRDREVPYGMKGGDI